jgi:hypothetical protein
MAAPANAAATNYVTTTGDITIHNQLHFAIDGGGSPPERLDGAAPRLRTEAAAAAAYAELTRRLTALGIDRFAYADTKDPACDLIMIAAEDWAIQSSWQPGPADAQTRRRHRADAPTAFGAEDGCRTSLVTV